MIRLSYALKLARTKLHSKRGVLITSILVASLLFAALIALVIVFTGAEKSALAFIKKAGNDTYLVKTQPNLPYEKISFLLTPSLEEIREIKAFEKRYYQELREKYKSLGIEYDALSEVPALEPYAYADKKLPEEQRVRVNFSSPVIAAMNEKKFEEYTKTATNKLSDLRAIGRQYGARGYTIASKPSPLPMLPQARLIQNGKEDFGVSEPRTGGDFGSYGFFTNAIYNSAYHFTDQKNVSRYILPTDISNLKGIPVIVSAQEAAALFGEKVGIGKEPESAGEKKRWLRDIQTKLKGQTYQVCYRNSVEQKMLEKIQRDYAEIKNNEQNKEYRKPSLLYDYPVEPCGDIVVKQDSRTATEKRADAKLEAVQKKLGSYAAPSHALLTFQIIGIKYAQPHLDHTKGVQEYVKSLLAPQGDALSIDIPIQLYDALPDSLKLEAIQKQDAPSAVLSKAFATDDFAPRILEFPTVEDARSFLKQEACPTSDTNCDKKFLADPYGSNYLILDEIGALFHNVAVIAFPVALGLAALIIWFTISRIMMENRKETAVYRAMGAKRRDVASIYLVYVLLIALQIVVVSAMLGVTAAFAVDYALGRTLTDVAATAFGIIDAAPAFRLFALESPLLLMIAGSIVGVSIVASIQPLIRNVRRSPIRDMREE